MADKLLLVTMFVVLTLPGLGSANRLPLWFTVLVISRDVAIVLTVAVVNLAVGPRTFRPSIFGKIATATYVITGVVALYFNYLERAVADRDGCSSTRRSSSPSSRPSTTACRCCGSGIRPLGSDHGLTPTDRATRASRK